MKSHHTYKFVKVDVKSSKISLNTLLCPYTTVTSQEIRKLALIMETIWYLLIPLCCSQMPCIDSDINLMIFTTKILASNMSPFWYAFRHLSQIWSCCGSQPWYPAWRRVEQVVHWWYCTLGTSYKGRGWYATSNAFLVGTSQHMPLHSRQQRLNHGSSAGRSPILCHSYHTSLWCSCNTARK